MSQDFDLEEPTSRTHLVAPPVARLRPLRVVISAEIGRLRDLAELLRADDHVVQRSSRVWETVDLVTRWPADVVVVHIEHDYSPRLALVHPLNPRARVVAVVGTHVSTETLVDSRVRGMWALFREPFDLVDLWQAVVR